MTVNDLWNPTRTQLSFLPIARAPVRVHVWPFCLPADVTCPGCCLQAANRQRRCVLCVFGVSGVHPSASSAGLAVAVETKHRLCFGVRQTCSLGPSHTHAGSLLFGGFCGLVASVGEGGQIPGRWLSLEEIRPALWHARHLLGRICTRSGEKTLHCLLLLTLRLKGG